MPDRSLELYLAQHYYSGPKSEAILNKYGDDGRKKKKKKKHTEGGDALTIKDDSSVWFGEEQEGDEDVAPEAVEVKEAPAPVATTKSQGWKNVREGEAVLPPTEAPPSAPREEQDTPAPPPIKAGLMSGAQLRAQREAREAAERAEREREAAEAAEAPPQETVYRDASGRKIDVEEEEARIREEHLRAEAKKKEREQWNQGLVQRREREAQRSELEAVQKEGVARYVFLLIQARKRRAYERRAERAHALGRPCGGLFDAALRPPCDAAAVHRPTASPQPLRHQAWVPLGRR